MDFVLSYTCAPLQPYAENTDVASIRLFASGDTMGKQLSHFIPLSFLDPTEVPLFNESFFSHRAHAEILHQLRAVLLASGGKWAENISFSPETPVNGSTGKCFPSASSISCFRTAS